MSTTRKPSFVDVGRAIETRLLSMQDDSIAVASLVEEFGEDTVHRLEGIASAYEGRGVMLHVRDGRVSIRTRPEASALALRYLADGRRAFSQALLDTVCVVRLYGPLSRSEIEDIRGVGLSPGVLERAVDLGLVSFGPRRDTPGRPMTWVAGPRMSEIFDADRSDSGIE